MRRGFFVVVGVTAMLFGAAAQASSVTLVCRAPPAELNGQAFDQTIVLGVDEAGGPVTVINYHPAARAFQAEFTEAYVVWRPGNSSDGIRREYRLDRHTGVLSFKATTSEGISRESIQGQCSRSQGDILK